MGWPKTGGTGEEDHPSGFRPGMAIPMGATAEYDAPMNGSTPAARPREDAAPHTARGRVLNLFLKFFGLLPLRLNHAIGAIIGQLFWWIPNRNRDVAFRNLELCFPDMDDHQRRRLVRANLHSMGQGLTELGWFWNRPREQVLSMIQRVEGLEVFDGALANGQGMVLAAPHLGAWELLCQYLASRTPSTILYREPRDPGVERVITQGRSRLGAQLVRADARGVRSVFKAAANHHLIGILPDQQPKKGQGEFAPFFGIQALTMVLVSKLVQRTRLPTVFGYCERLPKAQGFVLRFKAADPELASDNLATSVAALNRGVEACVRQCPEQYAWGYKRFSMRPDGSDPLY